MTNSNGMGSLNNECKRVKAKKFVLTPIVRIVFSLTELVVLILLLLNMIAVAEVIQITEVAVGDSSLFWTNFWVLLASFWFSVLVMEARYYKSMDYNEALDRASTIKGFYIGLAVLVFVSSAAAMTALEDLPISALYGYMALQAGLAAQLLRVQFLRNVVIRRLVLGS